MNDTILNRNLIFMQYALGAGSKSLLKLYKALLPLGLADTRFTSLNLAPYLEERRLSSIMEHDFSVVNEIIAECKSSSIDIITYCDPDYPNRLRNISEPPMVLYIKGQFPDVDAEPLFAIVGPRKVTRECERAGYALGYRLSRGGMTIVSGGALGTDAAAHRGALKAGGKTLAILGCGINFPYLTSNERLRNEIAENGCLISEYPPSYPCYKYNFPTRNRIISGISVGVAVTEAAFGSGTLITANSAISQEKPLFVIPGDRFDPRFEGSNSLFEFGAAPLKSANDIFSVFKPQFPDKIDEVRAFAKPKAEAQPIQSSEKNLPAGLSNAAKKVYNYISGEKFTADSIIGSGVSADELLSSLTELEMEHLITALPGGIYKINK